MGKKPNRAVVIILLLLFILPIAGVVVDSLYERHLRNKYGPALPFLQQDYLDALEAERIEERVEVMSP